MKENDGKVIESQEIGLQLNDPRRLEFDCQINVID